ncbi:peptidoglycan editing factor PgeF [soil metagenome]
MLINNPSFLTPNWSAPAHVHAYATTRNGGCSAPPYASFNLSYGVGDDPAAVTANRAYLAAALQLPITPLWLHQKHGTVVVSADENYVSAPAADASFATTANRVCLVATADCLPLLICDKAGTQVAAIHAGWRGLAAGIIEKTLQQFTAPPQQILAWLGPAIGANVFEVGDEVRDVYVQKYAKDAAFFQPGAQGKWLADLYQLARRRLQSMGITEIYGGEHCTYSDSQRFFSYRRDGQYSGRMTSLIWMTP